METIHVERKEENTLPTIINSDTELDKVIGLTYIIDGKKYVFSNELGHKVMSLNNSDKRPMTKTEFKEIRAKMASSIIKSDTIPEALVAELENLDFGLGHANGTFEVVTACLSKTKVGALVINLGHARYIYNQDANTVFHIDHSKRIIGNFMQEGPEKAKIIDKITSSKTMAKKLATMHS